MRYIVSKMSDTKFGNTIRHSLDNLILGQKDVLNVLHVIFKFLKKYKTVRKSIFKLLFILFLWNGNATAKCKTEEKCTSD